ncbi:hypothetical protein ANTQUA_LOCUS7420 [Anthophora quadrimaculata]
MNYTQYCDEKSDGSYLLHFNNSKGLSIPDVKKMFSTFGKVLTVYNRGQTHGLCFVICASFEDAKHCIDGFKSGKDIRILPHKYKTEAANMKHKAKKYDKKNTQDCKETSSPYNSKDENFGFMKLSNNHSQRFASNSSISTMHSDTSTTKCENMFDGSSIPALMPINDTLKTSSSVKVIPAETVIVANIHPGLSVHYILHLFQKYNPISVSVMMMTPTSKIRYCHVYYKTLDEACATMEKFDAYCLHGRNLIVLTKEKLIEQATQL